MPSRSHRSGFTLIEMIVSVGLFSVVMLIATGAYLSLINLDRKARATSDLVNNLNFTIDNIERELRAGSDYHLGSGGPQSLAFTNDLGQTVTYLYDGDDNSIGQCTGIGTCTAYTDQSLTDPRITITDVSFYVRGVGTGDYIQPWVTFTVTGSIKPDAITPPISFTIESSAAQRAIEL